jgi:hypothetical protein
MTSSTSLSPSLDSALQLQEGIEIVQERNSMCEAEVTGKRVGVGRS